MPKGKVTTVDFDALTDGPAKESLPTNAKGVTADANGERILNRLLNSESGTLTDGRRYGTSEDARTVGLRYQRMLERGLRNNDNHTDDGAKLIVRADGSGFVWIVSIGKRIYRKRKNRDDSTTPKTPDPTRADGNGKRDK